jgi:translation initiation factor IF-1
MSKKDLIVKTGTVIESLPDGVFKVRLDEEENEVMAYLSGKMRRAKIYVLLGDKVKMEFSPYDPNTGRIVYRFK